MRVGALASFRVKNVEFNQYGTMIYFQKRELTDYTGKGDTPYWSTGYLNQWLAVHFFHEDPEAPYGLPLTRIRNMWVIELLER
jgi:hypothetical protein